MARRWSNFPAAAFGACLIALSVVFALTTLGFHPPTPRGLDAPAEDFSAARAHAELAALIGDDTPHPVGSAANKNVEARLVERLTALGLRPQIQATIGCSTRWLACARVENVLARIDGATESSVLLMAHYDSVPTGPGAGDDGIGVATLIEIARILRSAPQLRNSVVFAFTDAEEPGLLGAEAFFAEHPWAQQVDTVINLEGAGSSGPSLLVRGEPWSGAVIDTFRRVAPHALAFSVSVEVFKRMPNDTDFSVAVGAGKPGLDFAIAGERNHHHTNRDTVANLNPASLQHHGDNVLPLVRSLADQDLSKGLPTYVYSTPAQSIWLSYSTTSGVALAIGVVIAMGFATWRRWQGLGPFGSALGTVALTLVLVVALEWFALALADLLSGTRVSWPANPWPWRMLIYATPVIGLAAMRRLVHRVGFWNTLLAAWWLWTLLALLLTAWLPLASHVLLPAALVASCVIVPLAYVPRLDRPDIRCAAATINALVAGFFVLPLVYLAEFTQGFALAPLMYLPLALLAVTLLPLLDRGHVLKSLSPALLSVVAGLVWVCWVPLYSTQRPQQLNFTYVLDADKDYARYAAWSPNSLPAAVRAAATFKREKSVLPWQRARLLAAPAPVQSRDVASVERQHVDGVTRAFMLRVAPGTDVVSLAIPASAPITGIRLDGHSLNVDAATTDKFRLVRFVAPPVEGINVEIDVTSPEPIGAFLIDTTYRLPDSAQPLVDARGPLATPVHDGDSWIVFRRVQI